jgi:hypothetical protein
MVSIQEMKNLVIYDQGKVAIIATKIGQAHTAFEDYITSMTTKQNQGILARKLISDANYVYPPLDPKLYGDLIFVAYDRYLGWKYLYDHLQPPQKGTADGIMGIAREMQSIANLYQYDNYRFGDVMNALLKLKYEYLPEGTALIHDIRAHFATYRDRLNLIQTRMANF